MSLIVTGTIGIDTVHTTTASAEKVLGGSCTYFAAAASFFTKVRLVAAAGEDFHEDYQAVFRKFPNVDVDGLEIRKGSKTFRWGGKYFDDMNHRETLFTELGVLVEKPPTPPAKYADSKFVFLANSHPMVQLQMLESFPQRLIAVADTMNLWIDSTKAELMGLLAKIDGLVVNDEEARMLTGKRNPFTAGKRILDMGPKFVVVKKGEHGCVLIHRDGIAALPAYPCEKVVDPTGAGDSFAGGMMGHLAASHTKDGRIDLPAVQQALAHGTVIASFTIESFSLDRLATLTKAEVAQRYTEFQSMVRV
jgi:sugar/nucleoside kinase (ribokinase family)